MTSIRITITDALLGDITVEHDDSTGSFSPARQREVIKRLMKIAAQQIEGAYNLNAISVKENA